VIASLLSQLPFGRKCSSDKSIPRAEVYFNYDCLNCLSAGSVLPTISSQAGAKRWRKSQLPFGRKCSSDVHGHGHYQRRLVQVSIAFRQEVFFRPGVDNYTLYKAAS